MNFASVPHGDLGDGFSGQLQELLARAFPDLEGDYYGHNPPDRIFLGLDADQPVAHLAAYKRTAIRDGDEIEIGMIGGVAVSSPYQRKGCAKHLISMAHTYFRFNEITCSILFAYAPDVYISSGYELVRFPIRFIEDGQVRELVYRGSMIAYLDAAPWTAALLDLQGEVV